MNLPPPLHEALLLFGVLDQFMQIVGVQGKSYQQLEVEVKRFKEDLEKKYKQLALKAHPDHGGTTEAMQRLNTARDVVRKVQVAPCPAPTIRVVFASPFFDNTTTTSSTTYYTTGFRTRTW